MGVGKVQAFQSACCACLTSLALRVIHVPGRKQNVLKQKDNKHAVHVPFVPGSEHLVWFSGVSL